MNTSGIWIFMIAAFMLNITPGVDMLYVIARSTGQGIKAGIISALGVSVGCVVHTVASALGLSIILAQSALAFSFIKYAGAIYLVYLGIRMLLQKTPAYTQQDLADTDLWSIFRQGLITNVLNPKVALFFLAFLPQFVDPLAGSAGFQIIMLGILFNTSGTLVNVIVAVISGKIGSRLGRWTKFQHFQHRLAGTILIALGIRIALISRK